MSFESGARRKEEREISKVGRDRKKEERVKVRRSRRSGKRKEEKEEGKKQGKPTKTQNHSKIAVKIYIH